MVATATKRSPARARRWSAPCWPAWPLPLPLHRWLLADARVQAAQFDTATLETWLAERTAAAQEV